MADQLAVFNIALSHLGARRLASLTEAREPARVLADEWDQAVRWCLEIAPWSFATRYAAIPHNGMVPPNAFANTLPKPADWIRTVDFAADPRLASALMHYAEEGPVWYADAGTVYVRYVSADAGYGFNPALWPPSFVDLVALRLAERCCRRITGSSEMLGDIIKLRTEAEKQALTVEEQTAARTFPAAAANGQTQLQAYNDALAYLGRARVVSLTQATDTVRELNDQWASCVRWALQQAPWSFAVKADIFTTVPQAAPVEGFPLIAAKPADWIATLDVATDLAFQAPIPNLLDEAGYWLTDAAQIAVRYVSADIAHGFDISRWPPEFVDLVALRLAERSCLRLTGGKDLLEGIVKLRTVALARATATEAATAARVYATADPASAVQLEIYNTALAQLGRERLVSLTQVRLDLRALNERWDPAIRWVLEQGPWTFAIRAVAMAPYGPRVPTFGYANAFLKPEDWMQTVTVSLDQRFERGNLRYADEAGYWFSDEPALFVRYVSSLDVYGYAMTRWPAAFRDLLGLRLAEEIGQRVGASAAQMQGVMVLRDRAIRRLRANDALNTPPVFPPIGSWVRSRRGGWAGERGGYGGAETAPSLTGDSTLGGDTGLPVNTDFIPRI